MPHDTKTGQVISDNRSGGVMTERLGLIVTKAMWDHLGRERNKNNILKSLGKSLKTPSELFLEIVQKAELKTLDRRKKLFPIRKQFISEGKKAVISVDKLYINGELFRSKDVTPWLYKINQTIFCRRLHSPTSFMPLFKTNEDIRMYASSSCSAQHALICSIVSVLYC